MFGEGFSKVFQASRPLDEWFYQPYACFTNLPFKDLSRIS